jgi:thiol-disulfide isomerase/thioredoxin
MNVKGPLSYSLVDRREMLGAAAGVLTTCLSSTRARASTRPPPAIASFQYVSPPILMPRVIMQGADESEADIGEVRRIPFVLNLWASWCAPCVAELPSLQAMNQRAAGRFRVVLVNQDRGGTAVALPFLSKLGVTGLSSYFDPQGRLFRALSVRGLPSTFFVNAGGNLLGRFEGGADWEAPEIIDFANSLIANGN